MKDNINKGEFLRKLRIANNLTQEELANEANVRKEDIIVWETGIKFPTDDETLERFASILGVEKDELVAGEYLDKYDMPEDDDAGEHKRNKFDLNKIDENKNESENNKNLLIVILLLIVGFILIILLFSKINKKEENVKTYYLYFENETIINNESYIDETMTSYRLYFNPVKSLNNKEIKNIVLYYKDGDKNINVINGENKLYDFTNSSYYDNKIKYLLNKDIYLDVIYEDNTNETTKVSISNEYKYENNSKVTHKVKNKSSEKIIYNTTVQSSYEYDVDGSILLKHGFQYKNNKYYYYIENGFVTYENNIIHVEVKKYKGKVIIERDVRRNEIKYIDYYSNNKSEIKYSPVINMVDCSKEECKYSSDYLKYITYLTYVINYNIG